MPGRARTTKALSVALRREVELASADSCLLRLGYEIVRHVEPVTAGIARDDETLRFGRTDAHW